MASNIIDLDRVEQVVSSLTNNEDKQQQQRYQPKTFNENNKSRYVYLPAFPTKSYGPNDYPLLANVPVTRLAAHEILQRQHGAYTSDALNIMNNYNYSAKDGFTLSEYDAKELAVRFNVGLSIITFNAERLRSICYTLAAFHESFRQNILHEKDVALEEPILNSKQMSVALEFFLQMDVDVFYMKTCSFRGADPSQLNTNGLFCEKNEPVEKYQMVPCGKLFCSCCYSRNNQQTYQSWTPIDFVSSSMHEFVNGYTTYLNCPATCTTSNIIYTMTCPCRQFDYVDSTAETLSDAMTYHRKHINRRIHEKLTGSSLFPGISRDPNERENEIANKMRLYQHSARCPVVLRSFLDCNPKYWCFIPLLWHDAQAEDIAYFQERSSSSSSSSFKIVDLEPTTIVAMAALGNLQVSHCLNQVPLSPAAYAFSHQQRQKQRVFFEEFLSSPIDQLPYSSMDLYQVAIIAVLPNDCSILLRYIIETLFIIHGETKLNMICPIGGGSRDSGQRYDRPYHLVWCNNLNRPFVVTTPPTH